MIIDLKHFSMFSKNAQLFLFRNYVIFSPFNLIISCLLFTSCQNSTKKQLVNQWDCVRIENIEPLDKNFISKEDSAVALKIESAVSNLIWTFNSNNTYQCSASGIVTTTGEYVLSSDGKILTLITSSKNNVNNYEVTNISAATLTLTNSATAKPIILHFKLH